MRSPRKLWSSPAGGPASNDGGYPYDPRDARSRRVRPPALSDRGRRVPGLSAARRMARAGRAREAGGVPRRASTGAGRCPASAIRGPACWSSGSRPPRTAATAPGRIFTGDRSGDFLFASLTARASPTSPTSDRARRRPAARRRVHHGRGAVRAAREQADARGTRRVPAVPRARARAPRRGPRRSSCSARSATKLRGRRCGTRRLASSRPAGRGSRTGSRSPCGRVTVVGAFHPSQQNTFTGRLTPPDARRGVRSRRARDAP